ncbi:MAG: hypothetical protein EOO03_01710 [Chitinophagaceae bacterium]|nr:MAG: hypothetical protein EOO03_01710 [Chitinophagaceae bacterium]
MSLQVAACGCLRNWHP